MVPIEKLPKCTAFVEKYLPNATAKEKQEAIYKTFAFFSALIELNDAQKDDNVDIFDNVK